MSKLGATGITLRWAAYLACSWTWCIGMFLPVLLVRDYGPWGFVVFGAPNIIGAAAMGWVLRAPGASERLVVRHRGAVRAFSTITLAYQLYFALWLAPQLSAPLLAVFAAAAAAPALAGLGRSLRALWRMTGLTVALTIAAAGVFIGAGGPTQPPVGQVNPRALLWVGPVCVFGFALCPYLDATFHTARQRAPGAPGTTAFTLGFGVFFAAMILFTFLFSGWIMGAPTSGGRFLLSLAGAAVVAHIGAQLLYTGRLHFDAIGALSGRQSGSAYGVALGLAVAAALATTFSGEYAGRTIGEVAYRLFLAFYGLVFPAYVWLCMIPTRDGHAGLSGPAGRRKLLIWCFAVGLGAPFYWMGFLGRDAEVFLAPGLALVLLMRLTLPRSRSRRPVPSVIAAH